MRAKTSSHLRCALLLAGLLAGAGCGAKTDEVAGGEGGSGTGGSASKGSGGAPGGGGAMASLGGAPGGAAGAGGGGSPSGLPVIVTTVFNNQGWFADPSLSSMFKPGSTIIHQAESIAGPCSMRDPAARGKCLKVV